MKIAKYLIAGFLFLLSGISNAVVIDGREWRQLTEATGFNWNQIVTVCRLGAGICNGKLRTTSFTGWNWASKDDVSNLFSYFLPEPTGPFDSRSASDRNSSWAPEFLSKFLPTSEAPLGKAVNAWTSTLSTNDPGFAFTPVIFDGVGDRLDVAFTSPVTKTDFQFGHEADVLGVWLYRDVTQVP